MAQSTLTKNTSQKAGQYSAHGKRLDVQGLRAIAVLAVVVNHMVGYPVGGFVGVDIFFVISGFVITLGLVREHESTGGLSFKDFYFRRVARILPAGILAILVTVTLSYFAFFTERANSIATDGLWALLFSANWRFALTGTDYWAENTPISPLQHYWSLGVEEQYYFIWPLVLVLVMGVAMKMGASKAGRRVSLAVVLAVLIAVSLAWSLMETRDNAAWAYFSTPSRTWELGIGALLAVINPLFRHISPTFRLVVAWLGIAGIAASITIITKTFTFPAPWAALPVAATALVIIAGTGGAVPGFQFLTNRVSTYIGNASYSLYLWHFPVIILFRALWPSDDVFYYPVQVLVMGFLACASYEFVELPSQRVLTRIYNGDRVKVSRRDRPRTFRTSYLVLGALIVGVAVVVPLSLRHTAPVETTLIPAPAPSAVASSSPAKDTNAGRLQSQIDKALTVTAWPDLNPSFDNIMDAGRPEEDGAGCSNTDLTLPSCVFDGGRSQTAVVFGDSTGITLLPTIRAALSDQYNLRGMTKAGCVMLDLKVKDDREGFSEQCAAFRYLPSQKSTESSRPLCS